MGHRWAKIWTPATTRPSARASASRLRVRRIARTPRYGGAAGECPDTTPRGSAAILCGRRLHFARARGRVVRAAPVAAALLALARVTLSISADSRSTTLLSSAFAISTSHRSVGDVSPLSTTQKFARPTPARSGTCESGIFRRLAIARMLRVSRRCAVSTSRNAGACLVCRSLVNHTGRRARRSGGGECEGSTGVQHARSCSNGKCSPCP